ncbi:MAG: type II/IV secretion system ATPase subunit [Dehalococcoidales bacterium]|nr:type II/IV secretion system ATPase subunit [Dehalococcoidales bacterium]
MATLVLPFEIEQKEETGTDLYNGELYKKLPPAFRDVVDNNLHLLEYLNMLPISQVGIPEFHTKPTKNMADIKEPNIIYPVSTGIFTHILVDHKDSRNNYIQIEPTLIDDINQLMQSVEEACITYADQLPAFNMETDREIQLLDYVEKVTTFDSPKPAEKKGLFGKLYHSDKSNISKVSVTSRELEKVKYLFIRDKVGLGVLQALINDPYIEDIGCSGLGQVYIDHKIFKSLKCTISFSDMDDLDQFVLRLAEQIQKPVDYKNPIADATLPDGSRINIVYGRDVSKRGSNFSIRKFSGVPLSIFDLVEFNTINYQMLAYMSLVVGNGMNVFVAGESASGKTAMLNALTTFISPMDKIITIEDTPELQVPHENWIREVVQTTDANDTSGAVGMFDLLKAALRQRPNEIMVGEIRGSEGNIAFQAMQTGHSVMATFHAASVEKLIQRLTSNPISVPKTYIDNLNVAILMSTVRLPNGKMGRRITDIAEISGYDSATESFSIVQSFHWDPEIDKFDFTGNMTSYVLEYKIAPMMGIPNSKKQLIYKEVDKRAKILAKLHRDEGITGFYEILEVLAKAQKQGIF